MRLSVKLTSAFYLEKQELNHLQFKYFLIFSNINSGGTDSFK